MLVLPSNPEPVCTDFTVESERIRRVNLSTVQNFPRMGMMLLLAGVGRFGGGGRGELAVSGNW